MAWLKLPKSTNKHLKRYAPLFLPGFAAIEVARWSGVRWLRSADLTPKRQSRWINRFHRRPGH